MLTCPALPHITNLPQRDPQLLGRSLMQSTREGATRSEFGNAMGRQDWTLRDGKRLSTKPGAILWATLIGASGQETACRVDTSDLEPWWMQ